MQSPAREDQPDPNAPVAATLSARSITSSAKTGPSVAIGRVTIKFVLNLSEFDVGQLTEDQRYEATLQLNTQVAAKLESLLGDRKGWTDMFDVELPANGVLTEKQARDLIRQKLNVETLSLMAAPAQVAMDVERICTPDGHCHWVIKTSAPLMIPNEQVPVAERNASKVPWFEEVQKGGRTIRAPIMAELMYADPGFWNPTRP
jgi:hypothetical protein